MFEYIEGKVAAKKIEYVVLDTGGVGYKLFTTMNTYEKVKGEVEKLYVHMHVREDIQKLYGFYDEEERKFFEILVNASGIGPKIAVAILSTYTTQELKSIISNEEVKRLTKVPGLGIKKAQKLMLDIKDKVDVTVHEDLGSTLAGVTPSVSSAQEDIKLALMSLGYKEKDMPKVFLKLGEITSVEDGIRRALKILNM